MTGHEIAKMRENAHLTQEALAAVVSEMTGEPLTRQSVQKWEDGTSFPARKRWEAIEKALDAQEGWLFELSKHRVAPTILSGDTITNTNGQAAKATGKSVVTFNHESISQSPPSQYQVTLTEKEYIAFELFRKVGNERLLDKCIAQMRKVESIMEW